MARFQSHDSLVVSWPVSRSSACFSSSDKSGHRSSAQPPEKAANVLDQQFRLAAEGYVVKDLIAYGDAWYQWYLRRLAERPANMTFVARQLLP